MQNKSITAYEFRPLSKELKDKDCRLLKRLSKSKECKNIINIPEWKAKNYVGALPLETVTLEILPKIFEGESEEEKNKNRLLLLRMLHISDYLKIREVELSSKDLVKQDIFEIMRYIFAKKLLEEVENGIYRTYENFERNENFLKGRLLLAQNIRENYILKNRFFVSIDDFTEDNSLNKVFKRTVNYLIEGSGKFSREYLMTLSLIFSDIESELDINKLIKLSESRFNRVNERFKPHFDIAKAFLQKTVPAVYTGKRMKTYGFIFSMDKLFERFVGNFLKKYKKDIFGNEYYDVQTQRQKYFGQLSIKPDIVIENDRKVIVIDTKYTGVPTNDDSKNSHLFQIYAYCMKHKEQFENKEVVGLLIYPKHINKESNIKDSITIGSGNDKFSVVVYRRLLDLRIQDDKKFKEEFIDKFKEVFNMPN